MAVYTHVSAEEIEDFISGYDVGEVLSFKGIAEGVENSNYLLRTRKNQYILTLYEKRVDENDLPFFLSLMEHLAEKGINCATPISDNKGRILKNLCGRPAALIGFLDGLSVMWPDAEHCMQLGVAMAQMHMAADDFILRRENDLSLDGWINLANKCEARADECSIGLSDIIKSELEYLKEKWPGHLPKGIIHADLFPDNVFFLDGHLSGLIDYYFACFDILSYDIAISMNSWCFEKDGSFNVTKASKLIAGYNNIRKLTAEEIEALPILCRGASLRFLLTRLYDWLNRVEGALVKTKDPLEYLKMLRFHQTVKSAGEYGVAVKK
jgi:homoserine kinase type II